MNLNEKLGGKEKSVSMINDFRETIRGYELRDLGYSGYPFTWSNKRAGSHIIEERLDRFLCDNSWGNYIQEKAVVHLVTWSSDHTPIFMEVLEKGKGKRYMRRTFHRVYYKDMWSPYEKCREIVKHEWKDGSCWTKNNPVELFKRKSK